jgi:hypothetical protein
LPVAYDNLSSGFREAVQWGPLVHGDLRDASALGEAMATHDVKAMIHFAGLMEVGRSTVKPDLLWDIKVAGTTNLLQVTRERGVGRLVFFSRAGGAQARAYIRQRAGSATASTADPHDVAGGWALGRHPSERISGFAAWLDSFPWVGELRARSADLVARFFRKWIEPLLHRKKLVRGA